MLSCSFSVGTVARSENKSNGMRKAQSSPGATGRIAARIKAARKNQTIGLRKEYILGFDHTPSSVQKSERCRRRLRDGCCYQAISRFEPQSGILSVMIP
jgi:hypothetical protein